jgi:hypothetical protein
MAKLSETPAGQPIRSQHKRFGDLAAVWSTLVRLDVADIVDEVAPRRGDAAASVGTYLALACANRIVDPCSKARVRRLVGHHRRAAVGEAGPGRDGSPPVLGRDGPPRRNRTAADRDPAVAADGHRVRAGFVRVGECGEHDREVGFDRFAFVVVDRSGLQVVWAYRSSSRCATGARVGLPACRPTSSPRAGAGRPARRSGIPPHRFGNARGAERGDGTPRHRRGTSLRTTGAGPLRWAHQIRSGV